jgi:hypothetical protein
VPDPYAVQVTYACSWKGLTEEYSNVLHYDAGALLNTEGGFENLADQVVAALRPLFHTEVTFKRVRVHGPTHLGKVEDQMRLVKDLTGTGSMTSAVVLNPEVAVVADVYMGRGPKGGKQYLRKYFRSLRLPGTGASEAMSRGMSPLATAQKTPYVSAMNTLKTVSVAGFTNDICNKEGKHLPLGSDWTVNDYVATRQFRKGKKRKGVAA